MTPTDHHHSGDAPLLSASRSNPARSRARVTGSLTHSLSKLHGLDLGPLFCFDSGEAGKGNECFFFFFFSKFFLFSFNSELKKKKTMQNGVVLVILTTALTEL